MADISVFTTPSGSSYNFKDAQARSDITSLQSAISGGGSLKVPLGTCNTSSGAQTKAVTISDSNWELVTGCVIGVRFGQSNGLASCKLNVNSTGAIDIYTESGFGANLKIRMAGVEGRIAYYLYDGTYWVWLGDGVDTNDDTLIYTTAYCSTSGGNSWKSANQTDYVLPSTGGYTVVSMKNANTYAGAIKLDINNKGAKSIYINGEASSSTNYTLPAGTYIVYYYSSKYYFRTDGKIPGPSNSVLYSSADTIPVSNGGTGSTTAGAAKANLKTVVSITGSKTWSQIYSILNELSTGDMCMVAIDSSLFKIITNSKITNAFRGCFCKTSSTYWDFFGDFGAGGFCTVRLESPTSSSVGTVTAQVATMTTL